MIAGLLGTVPAAVAVEFAAGFGQIVQQVIDFSFGGGGGRGDGGAGAQTKPARSAASGSCIAPLQLECADYARWGWACPTSTPPLCCAGLQGGVKLPTGGMPRRMPAASPRAPRSRFHDARVSRFGEKPKPTVIVRMRETRARL